MQKIVPHLWYDKQAKEAAQLYTSIFDNSRITDITTLKDTPSGDADMVSLQLCGQDFMMISAGPYFKFNPSISFLVACDSKEEVDILWNALSKGGSELMPLGEYPFSQRYSWLQDKFGLSWQLMYMGDRKSAQKIVPTLMFVGDQCGNAEKAVQFYTSVFHDTSVGEAMRYAEGEDPDKPGTVKHMGCTLEGMQFAAMDSARMHDFGFNEAVSFIINCENQKEIDYYWDKLSADPAAEQCGWLKDKFTVSWQVSPTAMHTMLQSGDEKKIAKVTEAFLKMKKFDISVLEKVYKEA